MSEQYTHSRQNDIETAAKAARRMTLGEAWKDLTPAERRKALKAAAGGAVVVTGATILGGPGLVGMASDSFENFKTPDEMVTYELFTLDQGEGLLEATQEEADEMIEALTLADKVDPAKVDLSNIHDIVNQASSRSLDLTGDTMLQPGAEFSLELMDLGATYEFDLFPVQRVQLGFDLEGDGTATEIQLPDTPAYEDDSETKNP